MVDDDGIWTIIFTSKYAQSLEPSDHCDVLKLQTRRNNGKRTQDTKEEEKESKINVEIENLEKNKNVENPTWHLDA